MDFDCCSTLNRKTGKGIKIPKYESKKIDEPSVKKNEHPNTVRCGNILCNIYEIPFEKVKNIARVGKNYRYFCNEFCYYEWLKNPSHLLW